MTVDVAGFLRAHEPFATLSPGALAGLARVVRSREFRDGERILARGDPGDAMYVIHSGEVRIPVVDPSGVERMVAKLSRGQFFGEMSLMTGDPRTADVYASGPVGALVIPKDAFVNLTRETPSLARFLTQILADRLNEGGLMSSRTIGKYQLTGELGRGGMSVVFHGIHTGLGKPVAVKMLNHRLAFDERFRASFQQEARVIAGLNHENVVQVYDTEQAYATYFIVMEYIAGSVLSRMIHASHRLPEHKVRDILVQMCRALSYAHANGIVHRDVKPNNVIMTPDGRAKLMDFGIACVQGREPRPEDDEVVGTAEYMAPEQIQGGAVDRRADIYALGVMAYEMLAGAPPFVAENPYDVLLAHLTKPLPPLAARSPGTSADLLEFVERATQKDPGRRFSTLEEAEALLSAGANASGGFLPREGKVLTIFYAPSEAGAVDRAVAALRQSLAGNPNVRLASASLAAP